jgi:hypothetical protein
MKTILSLSALLITLTLTAQSNPATWYFNDTSGTGIQIFGAIATGNYSLAVGDNATSSGSSSKALGVDTTASGNYSIAMGLGTIARGDDSTAMGNYTTASGIGSTAMGNGTEASGNYSTAMGANTTASGILSTALGFRTTASDYNSLVVGQNNLLGSIVTNNATDFNTANTAFVIGNGTNSENKSDALTVLFDGTTNFAGSVTATEFIGDGSQLTNLSVSSPFSLNDTSGNGIQSNNNTAIGEFSTAMGYQTTASGVISTALGSDTTASGNYSTAMGFVATASGDASTAIGTYTTASGVLSTAVGIATTASDYNSLVVGRHNLLGSTVTNSATEFSLENTAFVIGNGADADNRSDALTVLFDGTTNVAGSVTATSFIGDGSQLTNLTSNSPFSYNTNNEGGIEIADYTTASGSRAFAVGNDNLASGSSSTALGRGTIASGDDSTAMGANTEASGIGSTAMGHNTQASGSESTAMGHLTHAEAVYSTAMGNQTIATGWASTTMGTNTEANGFGSSSMGVYTKASDYGSLAVGHFNLLGSAVTASGAEFNSSNTAFVIGNGTNENNRSDALTVLFDGTTTIAGDLSINSDKKVFFGNQSFIEGATEGTVLILNANNNILFRPGGTTTVNFEPNGDAIFNGDVKVTSDKRLKSNIISLGSTLAKLLQIDGKTYTMKKDENKKQKIGVLAQDIEKVFPELVSESKGVKSVNYQGLVPVLINALKEQDSKMKEQESRIERLEKLLLDS